jgi:hypothetical protein
MHIPVLLEPLPGNRYRARAGEPFALTAEGATRDEALRQLRELIDRQLRNGAELTSFELPGENPWLRMCGIYDPDDPMVQEWLEIMEANRRKMDEEPDPW